MQMKNIDPNQLGKRQQQLFSTYFLEPQGLAGFSRRIYGMTKK